MSIFLRESEIPMSHCGSEPSAADALSDPLIQAIMAADANHPVALRALMLETIRKIELGFPVVTRRALIADGR
jgi:hypothetical protein